VYQSPWRHFPEELNFRQPRCENLKFRKFNVFNHRGQLGHSLCMFIQPRRVNVRTYLNPLTPNDHYIGRTAPLTSKRCILYIYSTNTGNEYFKHGIYCPFFFFQNAVCFIILTYLVHVLFTFYIQDVLKFKKIIPAPKVNYVLCCSRGTSVYTRLYTVVLK